MPTEDLLVPIPPEAAEQIRSAVASGEYASSSDVARAALLDWSHRRELRATGVAALREAWQESVSEEAPGLDPDEVFDALERKYRALAEAAA